MARQSRYTVQISFHDRSTEKIISPEVTLKAANGWKDVVDETVKAASVIDTVNGNETVWK